MVAFDAGKCSIVSYDKKLGPFQLKTNKIFNFEEQALGSNLRANPFHSNNRYNDFSTKDHLCRVEIDDTNEIAVLFHRP